MNLDITFDDLLDGGNHPARISNGRSSEELMQARRLKVLELYSSNRKHQIIPYVESLGFSRNTASTDLQWAKQEYMLLYGDVDSVQEIMLKHTAKYYEWAALAEATGELKLAKEMLQAAEKLRGFHSNTVAVQLNTGAVTNQTTNNYNLESGTPQQLEDLEKLLATMTPPADGPDATS